MGNYMVTGIAGFIAPYFILPLIKKGHSVVGLVREEKNLGSIEDVISSEDFEQLTSAGKLKLIQGDVTNAEEMNKIFSENKFQGVFHLAGNCNLAQIFKDPSGTFRLNALGTVNIADAIERFQPECRLMYMSTSAVYGNQDKTIDEKIPLAPVNPYGATKAAADFYVQERVRTKKLPFFITRVFNVSGPTHGEHISLGYFASTIIKIEKEIQQPLIKVGDLSSKRAFLDVRDLADVCVILMESPKSKGEIYNIGGDEVYSFQEILDKMLEIRGLTGKVKIKRDPALIRPVETPIQVSDSTKVKSLTGWKPEIPIEKTLRDLLDHYEKKYRVS